MLHSDPGKQPTIHKVLVVGAGAVGGYFGGRLRLAGVDVTFLLRSNRHMQVIENGIEVKSIDGDFLVYPPAVTTASDLRSADLIVLAVKCYDIPTVLAEIRPLVEKGAVILTLQNGISTEEEILQYFQADCVVAGVCFITSRLRTDGIIEHRQNGKISLGEWSGVDTARVSAIYQLFSGAGISTFLKNQIRSLKWEKLCWNATFNPLSVILDHPVSLVLDVPPLLEIVKEGVREVTAVAAAEGISLNPKIVDQTLSVTVPIRDYYTSMYEDYQNGKRTEIEYLNGELIRRGEKHGVPTPTIRMLYRFIKGLEKKREIRLQDLRRIG
ncbi:MAG: ketopantoate reductase family protein [Nitrospiria bacterium]